MIVAARGRYFNQLTGTRGFILPGGTDGIRTRASTRRWIKTRLHATTRVSTELEKV